MYRKRRGETDSMKTVILADRQARRLEPINEGQPGAMVRVLGRPVLEHMLQLLRLHGMTRAQIVAGQYEDRLREYFDDGRQFGVELSWEVPVSSAQASPHSLSPPVLGLTQDSRFSVARG